ncbi:MAG: aldehyde dehydrogenase [Alphaproteobacteria bacterium]
MTDLLTKTEYLNIIDNVRLPKMAWIDGKFVSAKSKKTYDSICPETEKVIAKIASCGKDDVDLAVKRARRTFKSGAWSKMCLDERKEILIRWAKLIKKHIHEIAAIEAYESGKPINDCVNVDLPETIHTLIWYAETVDKVFDKVAPTGDTAVSMIVKEPAGVVGAVLPWNFPLLMFAWKVGPALATGNSIIVKPSENTAMSTLRVAELAQEAGMPDGVLQILPGAGADVGKAMGMHMDIDMISFTGSTAVGKHFLKYSADSNLKEVVLELGGKSPFVVLADAKNLDDIAEHAIAAGFWNMGQNCSAGSRVIIHKKLKAELTKRIVQKVKKLSVGSHMDPKSNHGPLVSKVHYKRIMDYIASGKKQGAKLLCGGEKVGKTGYFVSPVVFDNVKPNMKVYKEEIFGPVLSIITADSDEHAVELANDTEYGLAGSVFTNDLRKAHKVAGQIKAGTVTVNCFGEGSVVTPFGGYKMSGFGGRDKGLEALEGYTNTKTIWLDMSDD